jgi:two-component system chemotaxis response regulator CheB
MEVVGGAKNGLEAVEQTKLLHPDIIAMDIDMPIMNGFEAAKRIMTETPTPIVIISNTLNVREVQVALQALKAGALTVLVKPGGPGTPEYESEGATFISTLKMMSQVKVVGHWPDQSMRNHTPYPGEGLTCLPNDKKCRIVAIAASTGGPVALNRIFSDIPGSFPVPILVVQHMSNGFMAGCATWLGENSSLKVKVGVDGEPLAPGTVYLAGPNRHMGVSPHFNLEYSSATPINSFRPSATYLFESVAKVYGASTLAIVLTGMGSDGVAGLKAVKEAGGWVLAQDQASSVVYGMPEEAFRSGYTDKVLPLTAIAPWLMEMIFSGGNK